ncbi:MAG: YgfZ/GcvT domain-containing protein, partial [Gammaproteobacteria bacterium]
MKPDWKAFLADNGAEFDDNGLLGFGNQVRELRASIGGNTMVDLCHEGLISVHGADAEQLLQGQLTNDVKQLAQGRSQLSAACTHKGRMMGLFRLFRRGDTIYMRLPRALLEPMIQRLRMFVLMSDAT